ncbi:MAG: sarcosine oxidase subunit gamma [Albidovulum sp.]|nr:sarcosine oxidase subunit gamma [Albidovulum sp.]MDE0303447.1 sarcosine oxidase subunit gamma [Albidovulum sp.]MDE0532414.1 sarcosine oxidase subunit gamma [Albidovulum sp.]
MPDSEAAVEIRGEIVVRLPEDYGMVSLRCALDTVEIEGALSRWAGTGMPGNGRFARTNKGSFAWMAPDELLLMVPLSELEPTLEAVRDLGKSIPLSAADVSDMRVLFEVSGTGSRDVVAKGAPLDLCSAEFGPGSFRRTRLAQVSVMVWMEKEPAIRLACRRSEADYVEEFLKFAATRGNPGFYS